jgi:hypothetical protein
MWVPPSSVALEALTLGTPNPRALSHNKCHQLGFSLPKCPLLTKLSSQNHVLNYLFLVDCDLFILCFHSSCILCVSFS